MRRLIETGQFPWVRRMMGRRQADVDDPKDRMSRRICPLKLARMTADASFLVIPSLSNKADLALQLYYAQLVLNLAWTPLFFGAKQKVRGLSSCTQTNLTCE